MIEDKQEFMANLMKKAHQLIAIGEYKKALKIGKQLQKVRYSGSYEILALAYYEEGQIDRAIKVLQEGVRKAPNVWLLWEQLGNYLSDKKHHKDAQKAYEQALKCTGADESSIKLNLAIDLSRADRRDEAIRICESLADSPLRLKALCLKTEVFVKQKKFNKAKRLANNLIREYGAGNEDENVAEYLARVYIALAELKLKTKQAVQGIADCIKKALILNRQNAEGLWLVREAHGKYSTKAKYFRLLIHGRWDRTLDKGRKPSGFYTSYDVVADNAKEALGYAREIECQSMRDSLALEECKVMQDRPEGPKGVYRVTGFSFYQLKDKNRKIKKP